MNSGTYFDNNFELSIKGQENFLYGRAEFAWSFINGRLDFQFDGLSLGDLYMDRGMVVLACGEDAVRKYESEVCQVILDNHVGEPA